MILITDPTVDQTANPIVILIADPTVDRTANPIVILIADPTVDRTANPIVILIAGPTVNPTANHGVDHRTDLILIRLAPNHMDKYYDINEKVNGYSILKYLGEGRFGIAYLAMNDKKEKCVVKQLKSEMLEESKERLSYEEQILNRLDNPKFPKFISRFHDDHAEGYLLEYIEGQVFYDLVIRNGYPFSKDKIYTVLGLLLEIIELLHSNNIVHRDIRLPNVILTPSNELALIDFGLARIMDNENYTQQEDYWYLGDFLIYLYYTNYNKENTEERPWYEELDLNPEESTFIKKLMGIDDCFHNMNEIKYQFEKMKSID